MKRITKIIRKIILENYKWSPEFQLFLKYQKENKNNDVYVRFSDQPMTKKIFFAHQVKNISGKDIEHIDPSGIYAFPLRFVIEQYHNLNINAFFPKKYVNILKDTSKNKFVISDPISSSDALNFLNKYYEISNFHQMVNLKNFIHMVELLVPVHFSKTVESELKKLDNKSNDAFHNVVFYNLTKIKKNIVKSVSESIAKNTKTLKDIDKQLSQYSFLNTKDFIASNDEQRLYWIRLGYDAIEDKNNVIYPATDKTAEKEQIVFLKEDSFEVLENYSKEGQLKAIQQTYRNNFFQSSNIELNQQKLPYFLRQIISFIFKNLLNDKLINISSNINEEFHIIKSTILGFSLGKTFLNKKQEKSEYQVLIGYGKYYKVVVIGALAYKDNNFSSENEYFQIEVCVVKKENNNGVFLKLYSSYEFNSLNEFLNTIKTDIDKNLEKGILFPLIDNDKEKSSISTDNGYDSEEEYEGYKDEKYMY